MRRRLTVILASDVAGYSRLMAAEEEQTIQRLKQAETAFGKLAESHHGRIFNTAGDAILAEFESAVSAVRFAIEFQATNRDRNRQFTPDQRLLFRVGIAAGDVVVGEDGNLLGDSVNIAARLQQLADPGGICVSDDVHLHSQDKLKLRSLDLGPQTLRNIPRPVKAYKILPSADAGSLMPNVLPDKRIWERRGFRVAIAAGLALLVTFALALRPRPVGEQLQSSDAITADSFNSLEVPLVSDRIRSNLADFGGLPDSKALAISHIGWGVASGASDKAAAEQQALDRCKQRDPLGACRLYSSGSKVVFPTLPKPLPADLRVVSLGIPVVPAELEGIRGMPTSAALDSYLKAGNHRALAVSDSVSATMTDRPDRREAIRLALERCSDRAHAACLVISVDGYLTVRIPRAHKALQPFTLASDSALTDSDRDKIAAIYAGRDWRALARGGTNHWYAVADMKSELEAVDQALAACRQAEPHCSLYAIGNFRVAE